MSKIQRNTNVFLVLILLFISAKGSVVALSDLTLVFALLVSIHVFIKRRLTFDRAFMFVVIGYICLTTLYLWQFGWINVTSSARVLLKLLLGYLVVKSVQEDLFLLFERIVVKLAFISLPLYLLQLISFSTLKQFVGWFENLFPALNYRGDWYVNTFFFTLNENGMYRNSGFAWEPKGFATFLVFAILINLLRNQFRSNKSFIVLLIALTTTLSTVGFFVLVTCIFYIYFRNNQTTISKLFIPLYLVGSIGVFSLDFMYNKIETEVDNREAHLKYVDVETDANSITLGRFGSMQLALLEFPKHPLIGIGMQDKERIQGKHTYLVWVNGLADWLSRFGLLGMLFLLISYSLSSKWLFYYFNAKGSTAWVIACLFLFFASAVIINPFFMAFQCYGFTKGSFKKIALNTNHINLQL